MTESSEYYADHNNIYVPNTFFTTRIYFCLPLKIYEFFWEFFSGVIAPQAPYSYATDTSFFQKKHPCRSKYEASKADKYLRTNMPVNIYQSEVYQT